MVMLTSAIVASVTYLLYLWYKSTITYWKDRGIKGPTPYPLVGNLAKVLTLQKSLDTHAYDIYKQFPNENVVGFYKGYKPSLLIKDPELLKYVFIKDFNIFQDRGFKKHDEDKFLDHLFAAEGNTWRVLRQKLTPIFTSGKLKSMIPLVDNAITGYIDYIEKLVDHGKDHEIRALASKYTLEVIGTCAFGVDMDTFTDAPNPFYDTGMLIFTPSILRSTIRTVDFFIPNFARYLYRYFNLGIESPKVENFFMKLVSEIVKQREGKKKLRNDFMDLMIEIKEQGTIQRQDDDKILELEMDDVLIASQSRVFFAAGFETSSATMSFLMYELALNPEIQQRLYEDVAKVTEKFDGKITYESIKEMSYLDMCFDEVLRKYPVVANLTRQCSENYTFPGTNITLEKGTGVTVSVLGLHRDPKFFKNPDVFDPERFSPENKHSINRLAYLPFGDGPRNCIGMRFAKVQSMMGMAAFIQKFRLEQSSKTPSYLEFDPRGITLTSKQGIWLKINRR